MANPQPMKVFAKRPRPLKDLDIVKIDNYNTPFDVEIWQKIGNNLPQLIQVHKFVPDVVIPPIPPVAGLLYDSNVHGLWANGKARTVTDYDKLLPKPFTNGKGMIIAASGNPWVEIDGKGVANLRAKKKGHGRFYVDSNNFNTQTTYGLRFEDEEVQNHTHQKQSRHQEEDQNEADNENAFGGTNHEVDFEGQKAGLKIEWYHDESGGKHTNFSDKPLPKEIAVGQWVQVRNTDLVDLSKKAIHLVSEINWLDGKGFIKVNETTMKDVPAFFIDEKVQKKSYSWYRINNANDVETKGISIKDIQEYQLPAVVA
jgi:hypothetical protein